MYKKTVTDQIDNTLKELREARNVGSPQRVALALSNLFNLLQTLNTCERPGYISEIKRIMSGYERLETDEENQKYREILDLFPEHIPDY
ncbi:MAG: hypothetical protein ABEI13_03225 [Candidatus Paceibacteria bacterium]